MFFMMGINQEQKELDFNQLVVCDICGSYGRHIVFVTCTVLSLFLIPIFRWNRHYYVKMSCCESLYELDEQIGRMIEKGEEIQISHNDLTLLNRHEQGTGHKRCFNCGYETDEDFEFCPKCGNRLE